MSSNTVISVENLSKMYRLGRVNSGSFGHDVKRWWANVRGKEDPFSMVASENDRTQKGSGSEYVWALKDVSFDVQKGDVLGIVGRNGAGKSTLLKMLTRVTLPTTGSIKAKGRIASLLEVGTGFHPDLTGRENIFLNGAILGMSKTEIKKKFDEIVDFSGVERYIDTPVKRYSSGMYVRLAFGVAAHLESEILIIDEVLAVGDTEFQKKCLGKMGDVANKEGRTVLFVSHNMTAVKSLCNKGLYMVNGKNQIYGNINDIMDNYFESSTNINLHYNHWDLDNAPGTDLAKLIEVELIKEEQILYIDSNISIKFKVFVNLDNLINKNINFSIVLTNKDDTPVFNVATQSKLVSEPYLEAICHIPANFLNDEYYKVRILLVKDKSVALFDLHDVISFKMEERNRDSDWHGKWIGMVRPVGIINWTF